MNNNYQTQFKELSAQKIAYRIIGQGAPIIFLNRFRGIMDTWDPLFIDLMAKDNQVILFDYPETGDSEGIFPKDGKAIADLVISLADSLNISKFNALGWSFGGLAAQSLAFYYPERVLKTIIVGSNPLGENEIPIEPVFYEHALKPVNDLDDEIVLFFEPKSQKSRDAATQSHERIYNQLDVKKIPSTQELLQKYLAASKEMKEDKEGFRAKYSSGEKDFLVVHGDHDISFSVKNWIPLIQNAPSLQLFVLPDSGHAPHHQNPSLVSGYVHNFLYERN